MRYLARIAIALTLSVPSALFAQTLAQLAPQPSFSLDVVSIKPSSPTSRATTGDFAPTGLNIIDMPLAKIISVAYLPQFQGSSVIGAPAWAQKEHYDIVGRIDELSAPAWLKLNNRQRYEAGTPLLQKVLADRCKLVAHLVPTLVDGYVLVVGKHGARLTPTKPNETYPDGVKNAFGDGSRVLSTTQPDGIVMQFFNVTIQDLTYQIGGLSGSVIQDQTGLNDRYDFTIKWLKIQRDPDGKPTIANPELFDLWDINSLGLEFKHAKVPAQNLVIDHIERPSPN